MTVSAEAVSAYWMSSAHFRALGMAKLEMESLSRLNSVAVIIAPAPIFAEQKYFFLTTKRINTLMSRVSVKDLSP